MFSQDNINKKDVILDQAGNIWSPYSSTKYFSNPKILIIYRDPRDIFSEFKGKQQVHILEIMFINFVHGTKILLTK